MNRIALVALDPDQPTEIIAVVRFDRLEETSSAKYAVIVGDAWQGLGLGTKLTQRYRSGTRGYIPRSLCVAKERQNAEPAS